MLLGLRLLVKEMNTTLILILYALGLPGMLFMYTRKARSVFCFYAMIDKSIKKPNQMMRVIM